jgi:hypothetical protein
VGRATCWGHFRDLRGPFHALPTRTLLEASRSGSFHGDATHTMSLSSRKLVTVYVLIRHGEGRRTGDLLGAAEFSRPFQHYLQRPPWRQDAVVAPTTITGSQQLCSRSPVGVYVPIGLEDGSWATSLLGAVGFMARQEDALP